MTKGCENFQCDYKDNWIYNNGFQERTNWSQILIFYTLLRCLIDVLRASSVMMFEGAVVVTIKQMGGDYGLQKLFGTFGAIIWGPISGQILDMASSSSGKENYEPIFYLFFVMRFISALLILKLNLSFKKPAKKVFKVRTKILDYNETFWFIESVEAHYQTAYSYVPCYLLCLWMHLGFHRSILILVSGGLGLNKAYNGNIPGRWYCCWYSTYNCKWSYHKKIWVSSDVGFHR